MTWLGNRRRKVAHVGPLELRVEHDSWGVSWCVDEDNLRISLRFGRSHGPDAIRAAQAAAVEAARSILFGWLEELKGVTK